MEVLTVRLTEELQRWLDELADKRAQVRIVARLRLHAGRGLQVHAGRDIKRARRVAAELGEEP